jgi:hypothetical protein
MGGLAGGAATVDLRGSPVVADRSAGEQIWPRGRTGCHRSAIEKQWMMTSLRGGT